MDSLLANYASSDEEEEEEEQQQQPQPQPQPQKPTPPKTTSFSFSLFSSLRQPKSSPSSSLFQSLPQPKQSPPAKATDILSGTSSNLSLSASLPNPKSQIEEQPKRVVQFKPPIIPLRKPTELEEEEDDDDEEERNRRRKLESSIQTPSVKSFLLSIPAPKNTATLGVQSSSGSGRRSIIETDTPAPASNSGGFTVEENEKVPIDQNNAGDYQNYEYAAEDNRNYQYAAEDNGNYQYATDQYGGYGNYNWGVEQDGGGGAGTATSSYGSNGGAYGDCGRYGNNWVDGSVPEASGVSESVVGIPGKKRCRNEVPMQVIEVKQDELIKNRPREDQAKLTGIAFGPSYQPVPTKGKPSKLHKRKHQIGSLYFDMKQNEMKLAERRAKGMLTKAETQAKYGW